MNADERYALLAYPQAIGERSEETLAMCLNRLMEADEPAETSTVVLDCGLRVVATAFAHARRHPSGRPLALTGACIVWTLDEYTQVEDALAQLAGVR